MVFSPHAALAEKVGGVWCCEPVDKLDLGAPEHHRLLLPLGKHAYQISI